MTYEAPDDAPPSPVPDSRLAIDTSEPPTDVPVPPTPPATANGSGGQDGRAPAPDSLGDVEVDATRTGGAQPAPSWEEIAEQYGDTVFTMAFRLTGDRDEARDLAQDVFVRVYRNLDRYRPGTFEGWLYRITKNLFLDRLRRRSRLRWEPLPDEEWRQPADGGPGPAERIDDRLLRGDLEVALQRLPASFRVAVVMCDVQALSYEEIAEATGWPIGTVRSRIHRGRRLLRRELGGGDHG